MNQKELLSILTGLSGHIHTDTKEEKNKFKKLFLYILLYQDANLEKIDLF